MTKRSTYGEGSIYQRCEARFGCPPKPADGERSKHKCAGRWYGVIDDVETIGYTETGGRKRIVLTAKTKAAVEHKLKLRRRDLIRGKVETSKVTVAKWADDYLALRVRELRPKAYHAAANPIRKWIVPTIGHRRLDQLRPADVRAVHAACRRADRQPADVHRALHTMLERAITEGHRVDPTALAVKAPAADKSDRAAMTIDQGLAVLAEASKMDNGIRWAFNLLYGARLGECAGLTWECVDLNAAEVVIEWQLQALPYNKHRDRSSGFRVPDAHEARHLVDAYHLTRPKSRAGYRVAPLLPPLVDAFQRWREVAPASPHGLVWPEPNGRPRWDRHDRAEWHALQERAGVHHPTRTRKVDGETLPAYFHMHECRNFAATMLLDAGVPEHVVTDLLGHTAVATSLRYRTRRREPLREAMERVAGVLGLG